MAPMLDDVSFVEGWASQMPTTAKSAPNKKRM